MITIIYSTHKDSEYNKNFKTHLINSVGLENVQILEYQNNNQYSLAQVYNSGITESIFDVVVCCHNDIKLEKGWGKKLLQDFEDNPDFAIIGKAGSCYFPKSGVYWEKMYETMVGQVWHHPTGQKKWINNYSPKLPFLIPVVTIDGLFISFDKTKIKHTFDETIGKFHFYDHSFCVPNYLDGIKLGVTSSFEITHESIGQPNQEFFESKELFVKKYKEVLPLDLKPEKVYVPEIKKKETTINGKVAVIIPTKGNIDMLIQCIDSFYEYCNPKLFDLFIADTGSTEDELEIIRKLESEIDNLKLIEYDYYNFAKINNDVVKNHLGKEHTYVLFSNNDIKLLSNVIDGMLEVFKTKNKVGTVGCRLHYEDNTIQHNGIQVFFNGNTKKIIVRNSNKDNYYNYSKDLTITLGNTASLMMMNKNTFLQVGGFNENYQECFEDVELNLLLLTKGFENYLLGSYPAYHYENRTRNLLETQYTIGSDFELYFVPFIDKNIKYLKDKLFFKK